MIKDQSYFNNESQVLFHDSNDELQRPYQFICDLVNDEDILVSYDLVDVFDEIQGNSKPLSSVDDDNEKHFALIPFDENQFQHLDKQHCGIRFVLLLLIIQKILRCMLFMMLW